jgi:hypothetical protein
MTFLHEILLKTQTEIIWYMNSKQQAVTKGANIGEYYIIQITAEV